MRLFSSISVAILFTGSLAGAVLWPCPIPASSAWDPSDKPQGDPQARQVVVEGSNTFAFDLYGRLSGGTDNLICSPYSISTALAMTRVGAKGETADQMTKVLHLPADPTQLTAGYANLIQEINGKGKPRQFQLLTANALWPQKGHPFHAGYVATVQNNFGAGLQELDYRNNLEPSRLTINRWVSEQTKQKIPELFAEGTLGRDYRLVLTNTIYFKADWAHAFPKKATQEKDFHLDASKSSKVSMMSQTEKFAYAEGEGFQAVELPYKDQDVSMLILLPRKKDGLPALEKALPKELLKKGLGKARKEVAVSLPRFKLGFGANLSEALKGMGMPLAFKEDADFTGMTEHKPFFIGTVIHKAIIEVDEEGTVAAAATGVGMRTTNAPLPPVVFNADHPFLFVIRDNRTGCILFMGRVTNPQG
jgi:serpin B